MMNWKSSLFFILLVVLWERSKAYPTGAPESVCQTMLPFHGGGIPPMSSPSPFRIETAASRINDGQILQVEIIGTPSVLSYGGFMIQARNRDFPHQVIGHFEQTDGIKLLSCDYKDSSATHTNKNPKQGLRLNWQAPLDFTGFIIFNATVAQEYDKFWTGIISKPVEIVNGEFSQSVVGISTTRTPLITTVPTYISNTEQKVESRDIFYASCGSTKTCFGFPDGCVKEENCRSVAAVTVKGDKHQFELKSGYNQPAYVAIGLSRDDKMGEDSVMECVREANKISLYFSWTTPRPNLDASREGVPQNIARLLESSYINGTIYCKIEREGITVVRNNKFDLINEQYYLLLAAGSNLKENGVDYHNRGRLQSAKALRLAVVEELVGASTILLRLHGAFMIAAWIGTTSVGILLARYFKQMWPGSQICGKDQWFAWHRFCMVTTWSLTMAAFIIIFIEIGAWSSERNPHAILGTITVIICFIQPIGALFRPGPNAKNRPIFNWIHWLGGNLAHILSIVTIFFAVKLTKAELPEWFDWILVAYVIFHVIMHLTFSVAGCVSERRSNQRVNSFPMTDMTPKGGRSHVKIDRKQSPPLSVLRKGLLAGYIIIITLFVAILVIIVVLAPIQDFIKKLNDK